MNLFVTQIKGNLPKGKTRPLHDVQSILLLQLITQEKNGVTPPVWSEKVEELPFLCAIVEQRIRGMNLPIRFTPTALIATMAFCRTPGEAVIFLIDCLQRKSPEPDGIRTVTLDDLNTILYPLGFYDVDTVEKYIDHYLKPKKVAWAEIY